MQLPQDVQCVVLDFDGTLTDVYAEASGFVEAYRADIAALLPLSPADFDAAWQQAQHTITTTPDRYGWRHFDGITNPIVAPAHTDPYIMPGCISHLLLDAHHILTDRNVRSQTLQAIFARHYQRASTHFRAHTAPFLHALRAQHIPIHIVTNSHTDAVTRKLQHLDLQPDAQHIVLHGNARKNVLTDPTQPDDPQFAPLREPARVQGLDRMVWRNRGHYFDVLQHVWRTTHTTPSHTLVCGDLYELDLAVPQALGAHVHLVTRHSTAPYEIAAVEAYDRGSYGDDLMRFFSQK